MLEAGGSSDINQQQTKAVPLDVLDADGVEATDNPRYFLTWRP